MKRILLNKSLNVRNYLKCYYYKISSYRTISSYSSSLSSPLSSSLSSLSSIHNISNGKIGLFGLNLLEPSDFIKYSNMAIIR